MTRKIDELRDIPIRVIAELGRTKKTIGDITQIHPGSTIELDTIEGADINLMIGDRIIARGKIVVIDQEYYGIQISEIIRK